MQKRCATSLLAPVALLVAFSSAFAQPARITVTAADSVPGRAATSGMGFMPTAKGKAPVVNAPRAEKENVYYGLIPPVVYDADVSNHGGVTLQNVSVHNVFVNPIPRGGNSYAQSPTGPTISDADTFLSSLFGSSMIHILDQYIGASSSRKVGQQGVIAYDSTKTTLHEADIQSLVHAAGRIFGGGPGQLVNIFTVEGIDVCTTFGGTGPEQCDSPDMPDISVFCAYHTAYDFPDLGRVYFTMQPFANADFCRVPNSAGVHGADIDAMANLLVHETFESISDPYGDAWYSQEFFTEMADLCAWYLNDAPMAQTSYRIQGVYTNAHHACAWTNSLF